MSPPSLEDKGDNHQLDQHRLAPIDKHDVTYPISRNQDPPSNFLSLTAEPQTPFKPQGHFVGESAFDKAAVSESPSEPQPFEITRHRFTTAGADYTLASPSSFEGGIGAAAALAGTSQHPAAKRRRFAPQLIETSRRTRRAGDTKPAVTQSDRTDVPAPDNKYFPGRIQSKILPVPPKNSPLVRSPVVTTNEARRLGIPLPKRTWSQSSIHSYTYRTTDLETIQSSESDRSAPRSRRSSHSSRSSVSYKHATRIRESVDESSSGYLLELAAKAAEEQLREQGLAAFPNDDRHQRISHFDISVTPNISSRGSELNLNLDRRISTNWDLKELQNHHARLEERREFEQRKREARRRLAKKLDENPSDMPVFQRHDGVRCGASAPRSTPRIWSEDDEWERMRSKARPPMLGTELEFPRCVSPEPARFDVTQGPEYLKQAMCYLSVTADPCGSGLWSPQKSTTSLSSMWSQRASRTSTNCGLWGGACLPSTDSGTKGQPGILTPRFPEAESVQPSLPIPAHNILPLLPPSPPPSHSGMSSLTAKLAIEEAIKKEFDDDFITQAYNYCSLGYPAIAWRYDAELSKISKIPIEELREDDHLPGSRGYIRLGENEQTDPEVTAETCARWRALKRYIHEWARQQPNMAKAPEMEGTWTAARKGSWGF